jgi:hypothetical protein
VRADRNPILYRELGTREFSPLPINVLTQLLERSTSVLNLYAMLDDGINVNERYPLLLHQPWPAFEGLDGLLHGGKRVALVAFARLGAYLTEFHGVSSMLQPH